MLSSHTARFLLETRELFLLGWPITLGFVGQVTNATVITYALSSISPTAVASVGLVLTFFTLSVVVFFAALSAITPLTAKLKGAGNPEKIGGLLKSGFSLATIFTALIFSLVLGLHELLYLAPLTPEGVQLGRDFIAIIAWNIPLDLCSMVVACTSIGLGKTFWVGIINFLGAVLIVPAVWVLGFGNLGFEPLGVEGCAYSLLLVTGLKTVFLFSLAFQSEFRGIRFVRHIKSPGENDFLTIIRVGAPLGLSEASLISFGAVNTLLMTRFGVEALAAHNIANSVFTVAHLFMVGLSRATVVRLSTLRGKSGSETEQRFCLITSLLLSLVLGLIAMSALTAFSTQWASLYSEDRKVVETLSCLIFIIGLLKLVDDPSLSMQAAIEACQKTKEIMITRATGCILGAFAAFFSSFWIGPIGIWIGVGALISWSLLVYAIRVRIHFWP